MLLGLDPRTIVLVGGGLHLVLPLVAWTILARRHEPRAVALWCGGGLLYGAAFVMVGLRASTPAWLFGAAGIAAIASYPIRALALRRELRAPGQARLCLAAIAALALLYAVLLATGAPESRHLAVAVIAHAIGAAWLSMLAWRLYAERHFRSAALLTGAFGLLTASLVLRLAFVAAGLEAATTMAGGADFLLVFVAGIVAALYGNLGYIGVALEAARAEELARATELARETEARLQNERRAVEQAALLGERERLLGQHKDMLAVLAHEVRQPLNNASAALQSAAEAIADRQVDRAAATTRLERANAVLLQVTAALDNTLTDAVLLEDDAAPARHDVDIDMLVDLAIGDIEPRLRYRIRRDRQTPTRTASMNAGLMRLALRNLVVNALAYSNENSEVIVRIADSDEPLALVIDVVDHGPGIAPELVPRVFERGVRGTESVRLGHGIGLYIVRRVAELHGGEVRVETTEGGGLTMRLVIPQDLSA